MKGRSMIETMRRAARTISGGAPRAFAACLFVAAALGAAAQAFEVRTEKDEGGWKLVVDGRDFQVKGVVWAFTPIGENYSYDLWSKPEEIGRAHV
jgi:hypothetical protein